MAPIRAEWACLMVKCSVLTLSIGQNSGVTVILTNHRKEPRMTKQQEWLLTSGGYTDQWEDRVYEL